jgi:hypothetical protein
LHVAVGQAPQGRWEVGQTKNSGADWTPWDGVGDRPDEEINVLCANIYDIF